MTVTRYIDDFWSSGVPLPPQDAYGMNYVVTAEGSSVVYLGVKVYFEERAGRLSVHTTVYDREFSYPYHIVRYPEFTSVAPQQQLGGVIMGRLVNCQEVCSHMKDFKESAGMVFRNAMWRGYPRRMVQSVWSRFLFQRWHSVDIRVKELRVWFSKVWVFLAKHGARNVPNPLKPAVPLKELEGSLLVLGCPQRLTSSSGFDAASSISVMECDFPEARILTNISHLNLNLTSSTVGSSFSVTSTSSSSSSTDGSDNNAVSRSSVSSRSAVRDRGGSGVNSGSISGGDVEKSFAAADSGIAVNSSLSSSTSTVIVTVEKVVENTVTVTVPVETTVERTVLVPVETTVERTVPVSVETTIERTVPVSVETTVERFVQVPVEKTVERLIQQLVSVDRTVPVSACDGGGLCSCARGTFGFHRVYRGTNCGSNSGG